MCVAKADYPIREIATRLANPRIDGYGYQAITVNPNPAVVFQNTHIDVKIGNSGANSASGITVDLAFNDWGLSFNGWQPIGSQVELLAFSVRCSVLTSAMLPPGPPGPARANNERDGRV